LVHSQFCIEALCVDITMDRKRKFFIEMSRDESHGGGSWSFLSCVFAPNQKRNGSDWPYWSSILDVQAGDVVLHLRGIPPQANFVGYSVASGHGHLTIQKPPDAGEWSHAEAFYKADLEGFVPFQPSINLNDVFGMRNEELRHYYAANGLNEKSKIRLFFVIQGGKLQCLNGAYFSEGDHELLDALFGDGIDLGNLSISSGKSKVYTAEGVAALKTRIGQREFSIRVKDGYANKCCFPRCPIDDSRFLVASHIARWSDAPHLRGDLHNGICLCVFHDRAFEVGVFTIDQNRRVFVNNGDNSKTAELLKQCSGLQIRTGSYPPSPELLLEHWIRIGVDPLT
jgi:putative restriction endonuclease